MVDKQAVLTVTLLSLLAAQAQDPQKRGVLSRLASRATDAVTDVVDPDVVLDKVNVDSIVQRVDVDALVQRIDVDELMRRVDVDDLVRRIDINQLLKEVDVDALIEQVDVNRLIERVDVDRLLDRVDVNRFMDRVDVEALVERAGIPEIVRESTGHMAGSVLDVGRRQVVGVDELAGRVLYRLSGRDALARPVAPPTLLGATEVDEKGRGQVTGHYSGPLSRLAAYAVDVAVIVGIYTLIAAGVTFVARVLFNVEVVDPLRTGIWAAVAFGTWSLLYDWLGPALTGRTVGKRIVGIRIVQRDGEPLRGRQALGRSLVKPFSLLAFGLGLLGIIWSKERRALHDAAAGTAVVYDWGQRTAEMPAPLTAFLARHDVDVAPEEA